MRIQSTLAAIFLFFATTAAAAEQPKSPEGQRPDIFTEEQQPIASDITKINVCLVTLMVAGKLSHMETAILGKFGLTNESYIERYIQDVRRSSAKYEFFQELETQKIGELQETGADDGVVNQLSEVSFLQAFGRIHGAMFTTASDPIKFASFMKGLSHQEQKCDQLAGQIG